MREMKDSGFSWIGKIPCNWSIQRVKHAFYRKNKKAMQDNPIILSLARSGVRERDISNNEGQIAESYYNYNPVDVDDLLINPMDLYSGANCSISKISGVISPAYINLRYKNGINPKFFDYYFKLQYWQMAFFSYGKGVSYENRWTLTADTLMNYPIVVPSYSEQCSITTYLDTKCAKIDSIIEKQEKVIEKLKAYKLSVITEAVTKGLNPDVKMKDSGVDWIGEIPEHWGIVKLKKLYQEVKNAIKVGPFGSQLKTGDYVPDGYWVYNQRVILDKNFNFNDTFISESKYESLKGFAVEAGDILITTRGTGTTGHIVQVPNNHPKGILHPCVMKFKLDESLIHYNLLFYIFEYSAYIREQINIANNTSSLPVLYSYTLNNLLIAIPPISEQQQITNYLDKKCSAIDKSIEQKQAIIEKLKEYKKSLIYEVVTGKKEV